MMNWDICRGINARAIRLCRLNTVIMSVLGWVNCPVLYSLRNCIITMVWESPVIMAISVL